MQKSQADYIEEVRQIKEKEKEMRNNQNRFQSQFLQEQERLARDIQEVRKSQITQILVNNKRLETERTCNKLWRSKGGTLLKLPYGQGTHQQGRHTPVGLTNKQIRI
ncbi:hypothetical protein PIB30_085792 [Stylosanthes scabra]|uniref:Uncharacterized protein n=1 Tax=Stylosanthes scabra TaxID=79078 RepID=A0ABU6QSG6_9FABA|nr:hypothetical protein [Stylosanthes scabra]